MPRKQFAPTVKKTATVTTSTYFGETPLYEFLKSLQENKITGRVEIQFSQGGVHRICLVEESEKIVDRK